MKILFRISLLILFVNLAQAQEFVTEQKYPFNFQGRHFEPSLTYDQWEVLSCQHDTRLWQGKDVNRTPCNWASKIQLQMSKWMTNPYKNNPVYTGFLKSFVDSIPMKDSEGQTPFETLIKKSGNYDDHETLLKSLIYFTAEEPKAVAIPLPGTETHSCWGENEEWSDRYGKCVCIKGYTRLNGYGRCYHPTEPRDH